MEQVVQAAAPKPERRRFTTEFKRKLVSATCEPGASVSAIALANGLNTNQLFAWRRQLLANTAQASLMPIHVVAPPEAAVPAASRGCIEIRLRHGELRIEGAVCADTLRVAIASLR